MTFGRKVEAAPEVEQRIVTLRRKGRSLQQIADTLTAEGTLSPRGKPYGLSSLYYILRRIAPDALPEGGHRSRR